MKTKAKEIENKKAFRVELHFTEKQNEIIEKAVRIENKKLNGEISRKSFLETTSLKISKEIIEANKFLKKKLPTKKS